MSMPNVVHPIHFRIPILALISRLHIPRAGE